ncbi:MAG: hypothetical protein QM817_31225 [Archangium sp.]
MIRHKLAAIPEKAQLQLPVAIAPSLDALVVKAPKVVPFTAEDLMLFADQLARERAPKMKRKYGEKLQLGDVAVIDVLAYHQGKLLPFSARQGMEIEVGAGDSLPWLDESLLECAVGDGLELPVTLPNDELVEAMRGAEVTYLVDVVSAYRVELPSVDSADFLSLLSRKATTLDGAMEELSEQLEAQRIAEAWEEARECVIDELVRRTEVTLSPELVDEEIKRAWMRVELPLLESKGFEPDELREALSGWLGDGPTRTDAERRLRLALGVKAFAEKEQLTFDKDAMKLMVDDAKARFGINKEEVRKALKDPRAPAHDQMVAVGIQMRVLELAMSAAKIDWV